MTYRRVLVVIELDRPAASAVGRDPAAIAGAARAIAAAGARFMLLPIVASSYELIARELPAAGAPDRALADLLDERDGIAQAFASRVAADLARARMAATDVVLVEAPAADAVLAIAEQRSADAILVPLAPGGRRAWPRPRSLADQLVTRAPTHIAVHLVRSASAQDQADEPVLTHPRPSRASRPAITARGLLRPQQVVAAPPFSATATRGETG